MIFEDIFFIGADTIRSRCYIQALTYNNLFPKCFIFLPGISKPGQFEYNNTIIYNNFFNPTETINTTCKKNSIELINAPSEDINSNDVIDFLRNLTCKYFIYSGFGGTILKNKLLNIGKRFIHIHGGYLPDFKGSTTNHYSILEEGLCGASSLFLNEYIDSGEIIFRMKFSPPNDIKELDYIYDNIFRAEVLVKTIHIYQHYGTFKTLEQQNYHTQPYYIMHPLLRHIVYLYSSSKNNV